MKIGESLMTNTTLNALNLSGDDNINIKILFRKEITMIITMIII